MFVFGIDDIIGIILLLLVVIYAIYIVIQSRVNDPTPHAQPKDQKKPVVVNNKTDPKTARALAVVGIFFAIAIAVALIVAL